MCHCSYEAGGLLDLGTFRQPADSFIMLKSQLLTSTDKPERKKKHPSSFCCSLLAYIVCSRMCGCAESVFAPVSVACACCVYLQVKNWYQHRQQAKPSVREAARKCEVCEISVRAAADSRQTGGGDTTGSVGGCGSDGDTCPPAVPSSGCLCLEASSSLTPSFWLEGASCFLSLQSVSKKKITNKKKTHYFLMFWMKSWILFSFFSLFTLLSVLKNLLLKIKVVIL